MSEHLLRVSIGEDVTEYQCYQVEAGPGGFKLTEVSAINGEELAEETDLTFSSGAEIVVLERGS